MVMYCDILRCSRDASRRDVADDHARCAEIRWDTHMRSGSCLGATRGTRVHFLPFLRAQECSIMIRVKRLLTLVKKLFVLVKKLFILVKGTPKVM